MCSSNRETHYSYYKSPIGLVEIGGTASAVTTLYFVDQRRTPCTSTPVVDRAIQQVEAYFQGRLSEFDVPLALQGTPFQQGVWQQLLAIPFGLTTSYQDVADAIGKPKAVRAVGAANGRNPVSIIVPCHRVIGSNGKLVGYGGGLWRKEWLLRHEGSLLL
jgi:methylated-DNA-[protein]-cysteine S-methyltransferase